MSRAEKAKRIAQKKRLGQPAGKPRRVEAARRKTSRKKKLGDIYGWFDEEKRLQNGWHDEEKRHEKWW